MKGTERVIVTGGGSGIGRAVALAVLAGGGRVAVVGRRREPLAALAREHPDRVVPLPCDVTDPRAREGLIARARAALGGLDGFVHSAGVVRHERLGQVSDAALEEQLAVHLVAPLRLGEQALVELDPGGAMVMVASTLALRPVVTSAAYSAAKAGLIALAQVLALAGAERGVRVNAVSPGIVDTEMIARERIPGLVALHPLGRLGRVEEVAAAVLHLLGASWTTGTNFVVDGGLLARE